MVNSASSADFRPSRVHRQPEPQPLDYLFLTNADQKHMADLKGLEAAGIDVTALTYNASYTGNEAIAKSLVQLLADIDDEVTRSSALLLLPRAQSGSGIERLEE